MTTTVAAARSPQGSSCRLGNRAIATGAVRDRSVAVSVSANMNSFHEKMNARRPAAASPGRAIGSTTDQSARPGPHPSTRAAR